MTRLLCPAPATTTSASGTGIPGRKKAVARISYVDLASITDPELAADMEHSRLYGTPRPETQAIRFHVPNVAKAFSRPWESIFRRGIVEHALKELCRVYVSKTIDCHY